MTTEKKLVRILQLYPREMNIYGDHGNLLTLRRRLEWRGFSVETLVHNPGDALNSDVDIIIGGGGQDSGQTKIQDDLLKNGATLRRLADSGMPMLMICGMYQLFGKSFQTTTNEMIRGIAVFDMETIGGPKRLVGNIIIDTPHFGRIVGYENHSGLTTLHGNQESLGRVIQGAGNDTYGYEGAVTNNVIGSYLHGPILPKNPQFADHLIQLAVQRKYGDDTLLELDDRLESRARDIAMKRPR